MHHPGELGLSPRSTPARDFPAFRGGFSTVTSTYPNRLGFVTTSRRVVRERWFHPQIHTLFYDYLYVIRKNR
jgi:hypothetical protein